jgi:hypothetical protein
MGGLIMARNLQSRELFFGHMNISDNSTEQVINTQDKYHLSRLFSETNTKGFLFNAGSTGLVTVFANAGGGQVTVTSAGHGLATGDIVSITGTTNYNDIYQISNAQTNTFEITETWAGDDATGTWDQGSSLKAQNSRNYFLSVCISSQVASPNQTLQYAVYKNAGEETSTEVRRRFSTIDIGSISLCGLFFADAGDVLTLAVKNITGTANLTNNFVSFCLHALD